METTTMERKCTTVKDGKYIRMTQKSKDALNALNMLFKPIPEDKKQLGKFRNKLALEEIRETMCMVVNRHIIKEPKAVTTWNLNAPKGQPVIQVKFLKPRIKIDLTPYQEEHNLFVKEMYL